MNHPRKAVYASSPYILLVFSEQKYIIIRTHVVSASVILIMRKSFRFLFSQSQGHLYKQMSTHLATFEQTPTHTHSISQTVSNITPYWVQ